MRTGVNRYGKPFCLPEDSNTKGEKAVEAILKDIGVNYQMQFVFADYKQQAFDACVFDVDDNPALLIEFDGEPHYDETFFYNAGNRPERNKMHLCKQSIGDAYKDYIALEKRVPLVRIDKLYIPHLRDFLISYIYVFVDKGIKESNETMVLKALDKYGWDFIYVEERKPTQNTKAYLDEHPTVND